MADAEQTLDLSDTKHEESGDSAADEAEAEPQQTQEDTNGAKTNAEDKEPKEKSRKSHRYHPYKERRSGSVDLKASHRNRVFISNIPYDMKWQAIKDLMREKVGEVTYVELFKDGEGKSRGCGVVEFRDEEFVKKAIEVMSKHDLNGRPLNIKEDPDGEHARRLPSLALTAMFNGQMLFDRQMHVKMDDKSLPPDDFRPAEKPPQLPRGLGGVGMGLGPGGQPINANRLSGGGVGSMGPGGMDGPGCSNMNRMSGIGGGFSGMDCMGGMGGFGGRDMGRMGDVYRSGMGGMDRDFGRRDMEMNRPFGDSFGGRCGGYAVMGNAGMGPMGTGLGMVNMGMDRMNSGFDRMGGNMDMGRGFGQYGGGSGHMGGMSDRGAGTKAGCQIFVRNLSYDLTWQKLKEKFSYCGQVMYAEIKMENGKSKGCGTVRFDSPESAEKACRMMNGTQINGREVDIRIDRNA
ncbi:myelin expression factor 2 [Sinocyclocheilus grahami]|uniref:myelin expression factor 2 n=1 Tax=Sinocyclocheilus grahami TaxID=75366 RepID=UPI0007AC6FD2|nr:PREDICTED: myelin expression factor 2 [Sinocyclocheilus grahami]